MENEKRLIDANAYPCQTCEVSYCYKNCKKLDAWFNKTVDAVEVVRCEDCKYFGHNIENDTYCRCTGGLSDPEENDFCSYGERRTDGN